MLQLGRDRAGPRRSIASSQRRLDHQSDLDIDCRGPFDLEYRASSLDLTLDLPRVAAEVRRHSTRWPDPEGALGQVPARTVTRVDPRPPRSLAEECGDPIKREARDLPVAPSDHPKVAQSACDLATRTRKHHSGRCEPKWALTPAITPLFVAALGSTRSHVCNAVAEGTVKAVPSRSTAATTGMRIRCLIESPCP